MGVLDEYLLIRSRITAAVETALAGPIAEGLKEQIKITAMENVYSYGPKFFSRRMEAGGLIAEGNLKSTASGMDLTIENTTGLQNLYGGSDGSALTPIVESGAANYHMPGAREFMEPTLETYVASGKAGEALGSALRAAGFEVI